MKLTDWIILFTLITGIFIAGLVYRTNANSKAVATNTRYTDALTSACEDAIRTINTEQIEKAWPTSKERDKTLRTFYNTLAFCFNSEFTSEADNTHRYTPIVCLIDTDGYYIAYNSVFDESGNAFVFDSTGHVEHGMFSQYHNAASDPDAKAFDESLTTSPINTWTAQYGDYSVRYFLDDTLEILIPDGRLYKGHRKEVKDLIIKLATYGGNGTKDPNNEGKLIEPVIWMNTGKTAKDADHYDIKAPREKESLYAVLTDDKFYEEEKNATIVSKINTEVEYYINYRNVLAKNNEIPYGYTMPQIRGEDWHRLLENPTVISFLQGTQMSTGKELVNIYSTGGGELVKEHGYFVMDGDYHYLRSLNCPDYVVRSRIVRQEITYEGGKRDGEDADHDGIEDKTYFETEVYYYRDRSTWTDADEGIREGLLKDGKWWKDRSDSGWWDDGHWQRIDKIYNSMEECARHGAEACDCARNHNGR